jgi:hypothetical protein
MALNLRKIASNREKVMEHYRRKISDIKIDWEADNTDKDRDYNPETDGVYIYPNQILDANNIVDLFRTNCRVVSVKKRTKIGADGLMIEIAKILTTHNDDNFIIDYRNVRIITGMSNTDWQDNLQKKVPACFKDSVFHHGQLSKCNLPTKDALIIIDEIDAGTDEGSVIHKTLKKAGIWSIDYMIENNIRLVFISATMIQQEYVLTHWKDHHETYTMAIPPNYAGHDFFLEQKIIQEYYDLNKIKNAEKWVKEDIIDNYRNDYRVHIIRIKPIKKDKSSSSTLAIKAVNNIKTVCESNDVVFINHNSDEELSKIELKALFESPLTYHVVLAVKGFYRRAYEIVNKWKFRIGCVHELFTMTPDSDTLVQSLVGRMTGYWKDKLLAGHKTGPYRTSVKAIEAYEDWFKEINDEELKYKTTTFKKDGKTIRSAPHMLDLKNVSSDPIVPIHSPPVRHKASQEIIVIDISEEDMSKCKKKNGHAFAKGGFEIACKYKPTECNYYKSYTLTTLSLNTVAKQKASGLTQLLSEGAISGERSCAKLPKDTNVLMIYLYENKLILSPWAGAEDE